MTVYKNQLKVYSETYDSNSIHNIREQVNHEISPVGLWIGYMPSVPEQASSKKLEIEWKKEKIKRQKLSKPVQLEFEFPDEF